MPFFPVFAKRTLALTPWIDFGAPGTGAGLDTLAKEKRAEREAAMGGPKRALTSMLDDPDATQVRRHQGLTLVHFSAQLEPCLTHKNTQNTP